MVCSAVLRCVLNLASRLKQGLAVSLLPTLLLANASAALAAFPQCPSIGLSSGCAVLVTINPSGSLTLQFDRSVPPFDGDDDALVGVVNKSGATVFGITLRGRGIFDFDGDGTGSRVGTGGATGYEGPGTSFTIIDINSGIVNFTDAGLANNESRWFSLEGGPTGIKLTASVTIDPGHGTADCPFGRTGATGPTKFSSNSSPPAQLLEYKLAWQIATSLQFILFQRGYTVKKTKINEVECPRYAERDEVANKARSNIFISIHLDGLENQSVGGTSSLYNSSKSASQTLARLTAAAVSNALNTINRGPLARDDLAVLKAGATMMAAVMSEVATISNAGGDELIMSNDASIKIAALAIADALDSYLNQ